MRSLVLCLSLLAGCGAAAEPTTLEVAAAASLTEVTPALGEALRVPIRARFDASSTLARQIEAGAPADVLLSADEAWADHVVAAGLADASDRVPFATNHLVVVVPRERPAAPARLADLGALAHVAVAAAEVPAGRVARAALEHEGLLAAMTPRLVDAPSVRGALAWVARGEAEAAIVYATDARVEPAVRVAFEIDSSAAPPVVDVALALHGPRHDAALAFAQALRSPSAQSLLAEAGFGPPP